MTILDETRAYLAQQSDKLQAERSRLVTERDNLSGQISDIDALLRQLNSLSAKPASRVTGRRSGIRDDVLDAIAKGANNPRAVRTALNLTGKSASQSVSNALSALKKDGKITQNGGVYAIA